MRIVLSIVVACFFLGGPTAALADDDSWLASSRIQIMQDFGVTGTKEIASDQHAPADVSMLHDKGDTVWVAINTKLNFRLAMAGRGNRVHSMRIFIPILNLSAEQSAEAFKALVSFFEAEFPNWRGAKDWPGHSLNSSWQATGNAMDNKPFDPDAIITKKTIGSVTISTFGVPPDIILYAATARAICIPTQGTAEARINPIQRLVC